MPRPRIPTKTSKSEDIVFVHGRSEDGKKLAVLRKRGDAISAGILSTVEEGRPLTGELLKLSPRAANPSVCDVEVLHAPSEAPRTATDDVSSGPAQVATPEYRAGWNSIWGRAAKARSSAELN